MDPFVYDSFNGDIQNVVLDGKYLVRNVTTLGLTNALVRDVESKFNDIGMTLKLDLLFPELIYSGFYKTNLHLTGIKLLSKGEFNATLKNVNNKWTLKGKLVNIDGEKYMKMYDTDIDTDIEDVRASISGVFEDPTLSELKRLKKFQEKSEIKSLPQTLS